MLLVIQSYQGLFIEIKMLDFKLYEQLNFEFYIKTIIKQNDEIIRLLEKIMNKERNAPILISSISLVCD